MAKIWPVYEGKQATFGGPWARLPLSEAIDLFELRQDDFWSDLDSIPRIGDVDRDLTYAGYKHIIVEIERNEARQANWKPGFYRSRIAPKKAFEILIWQALATKLGKDKVVRLATASSTDSQGRDALKITVVIAPDALKSFQGDAVLDALVGLRERLREMRDDRIPIVEYATEAELEHYGSP